MVFSFRNNQLIFAIVLFVLMQLVLVVHITTKNFFKSNHESEIISHLIPPPEDKKDAMNDTELLLFDDTMKTDYPCFPPRHVQMQQQENEKPTIIYLETAYVNLHYETYYSFIDRLCSCNNENDVWTINTNTPPHFYVGPDDYLTLGFERVLQEYNTTTCGPIFFGTPKDPQLTVVTTSYPSDFELESNSQYHKQINDPRYIFICHEDAPLLEANASNVFFLTPRHNRYIVPSYFPPSLVQKHSKSTHQQHPEKPPIFLVLGSFNNGYRRNVRSLIYPLRHYRDKNFTLRFLGGSSESVTNDGLKQKLQAQFPEDYHKIELLPRTDTDEFMVRVAESDVILPLVDEGNFYHYNNGYQGGKKLTSSVMWGLGFHKPMILYRPLAEVFGIQEDNITYFLHGESTAHSIPFFDAFGRCLEHVLGD